MGDRRRNCRKKSRRTTTDNNNLGLLLNIPHFIGELNIFKIT
jgi:hypothetical protein